MSGNITLSMMILFVGGIGIRDSIETFEVVKVRLAVVLVPLSLALDAPNHIVFPQ